MSLLLRLVPLSAIELSDGSVDTTEIHLRCAASERGMQVRGARL
ncbi:hypothetical protein [Caballeronia zhejiangensis]|nr:hypothetical protein [Caballeronia zhejiangensis]